MNTRTRYTPKQLAFLRKGYLSMSVRDLTPAFNAAFSTDKTENQIRSTLKNHGIVCGRKPKERFSRSLIYTEPQIAFLRENYPGHSVKGLTDLFNKTFSENKTENQIRAAVNNRGILSGRTGRFGKGQSPWNKGAKGYMGANATSFKKGDIPRNKRKLWSERINKDGFIEISIPECNPHTGAVTRFKHKHVWIWENNNGPVPEGHAIIFIDADTQHCVLENLMLVTRAELLSMNLHNYKGTPSQLKPSVLSLAKLETKAGFRLKPARGRRKQGTTGAPQ